MNPLLKFPKVQFGFGVIEILSAELRELGINRPLFITDQGVVKCGVFSKVREAIPANAEAAVFDETPENPTVGGVEGAFARYRSLGCNGIVAVGGGSVIDTSKAVSMLAGHSKPFAYYHDHPEEITSSAAPIVAIPTTAGTGSEATRGAGIHPDSKSRSSGISSEYLVPKTAICDVDLTLSLPAGLTAATGMDALTHHMEAFLVNMFHPMCDGIALQGISLIHHSLEKAVNHPDLESRSRMLIASLMGAVAFQKGLGVVHSLAHPLSSLLDTHHGLANAVNIPYGMEFNITGSEHKFKQIASALQLKKESGEEAVRYLFELNEKIHIPRNLAYIGVKSEHIETLSVLALADFAHPNNPKPVTQENFKQLYLKAL
jgi:alcohol dehydrogenase class IV